MKILWGTFKKESNKRIGGAPEPQRKGGKGRIGSSSSAFSGDTTAYSPTGLGIRSQQGKQLPGGNFTQPLPPQCGAFWNSLGDVSTWRWKKASSATQQLVAGAALIPPRSSVSADAEVIRVKYPQIINFCYCHKTKRSKKTGKKMGRCPKEKRVIGSCQFLFNSGKIPQAVMQLLLFTIVILFTISYLLIVVTILI